MSHKAFLGVAVFLGLLTLAGCGSFFTQKESINGSEIYTVTSTQDADNPALIHIQVDVKSAELLALKASLGSSYRAPTKINIWMGVQSKAITDPYLAVELRPLTTIPVGSDFTSAMVDVNLLSLMSGSNNSLGWLYSEYFAKDGYNSMTGYYLFASDAWSYSSNTSKTYDIDLYNEVGNHSFTFPDRFPVGQGISACSRLLSPSFVTIINTDGWAGPATTTVGVGSAITLTYTSSNSSSYPSLNFYGQGGSYPYYYGISSPMAPTLDSNGKYVWTFNLEFTDYGNPFTYVTNDGATIIYVPIDGDFNLSSQNTWDSYYAYYTFMLP
jgi:hypothetical protein